MPKPWISQQRISDLAKLKQKKHRLAQGRVVVEGSRLIRQLAIFGIRPYELYVFGDQQQEYRQLVQYKLTQSQMSRICSSEHPASVAALYDLPQESAAPFRRALYLDRISDPGNLGTIFRSAEAFGMDAILLSEDSCEVSNPKVIRASMGAVYKLTFRYLSPEELLMGKARLVALDMGGRVSLRDYVPSAEAEIFILGSEAHGIDEALLRAAHQSIRIDMAGKMESLNLAVSAALLCYQLSMQER